jgi:hypothetical protein
VLLTRLPLPVARAFDLHVLSLPPAFALSQDQTLKFWMRFETAKSQRLTRFRHLQDCSRSPWVLNLKRVTAEVSSGRFRSKGCPLARKRPARTPPSTFLFLPIHLSNSPGPKPTPTLRKTEEPSKLQPPIRTGSIFTYISEELQRRAITPWRAARRVGVYRPRSIPMSTPGPEKRS